MNDKATMHQGRFHEPFRFRILRICNYGPWAVVVAQLADRSLPIPEVRCSKPVIGKYF